MKKAILIDSDVLEYIYTPQDTRGHKVSFEYEDKNYSYDVTDLGGELLLKSNGVQKRILYAKKGQKTYLSIGTKTFFLRENKTSLYVAKPSEEDEHGLAVSPMPGKILKILVSKGDRVKKGQTLIILEAMKMEHMIKSPTAAVVSAIPFKEGELVGENVSLVELEKN